MLEAGVQIGQLLRRAVDQGHDALVRLREGPASVLQVVEREAHGRVPRGGRRHETARLVERGDGFLDGVRPRPALVVGVEDPDVHALDRLGGGLEVDRSALRAALEKVRGAADAVVRTLEIEHPLRRPRLAVAGLGP